jgi:hypothetical protein
MTYHRVTTVTRLDALVVLELLTHLDHLSSTLIFNGVPGNKSSTTSHTSGAGTVYTSGPPEFTLDF